MERNPYESPASGVEQPARRGGILFRILAVLLWFVSLNLLVAFWMWVTDPKSIERRTSDPALFWYIGGVGAVLPAFGLAVLGIASWSRMRRLVYVGLALFAPVTLTVLYLWLRRLF